MVSERPVTTLATMASRAMHLGHIQKIAIRFHPFDPVAKLCREFTRRVRVRVRVRCVCVCVVPWRRVLRIAWVPLGASLRTGCVCCNCPCLSTPGSLFGVSVSPIPAGFEIKKASKRNPH